MKTIQEYLSEVESFRMEKKCLHKEDTVLFAKSHKSFLQSYAELPDGIPSHDTFRCVFSLLSPGVLRQCLNGYGKDIIRILPEKQICPDGKNSEAYHRQAGAIKGCTLC